MTTNNRRFLALLVFTTTLLIPVLDGFGQRQRQRPKPVAIQGATVHTMTGDVLEDATVIIERGKIKAVGTDLSVENCEVIDAGGKTVIPGIIDAASSLMRVDGAFSQRKPHSKVLDAVDPYDTHEIREAVRNGVTSAFVSPAGNAAIFGVGTVLKLQPDAPLSGRLLLEESAVCGALGSGQRLGPLLRIKELETMRKLFEQAESYLEAQEKYEEEFEEYKAEIEKRQKANGKDEADKPDAEKEKSGDDGDKPAADDKKDDAPAPEQGERRRRPRRGGGGGGSADFGHLLATARFGDLEALDTAKGEDDPLTAEERLVVDFFRAAEEDKKQGGGGGKDAAGGDAKKKEDSAKDDLKKPKKPRRDPAKEMLGRVLDREIPLRVEVHRAEDIHNLLELADELRIDLIIEGASEAWKVADAIADADVPVIIDGTPVNPRTIGGKRRGASPSNAAQLEKAGAALAISSGGNRNQSRFVWLNAGIAAGHGLSSEAALRAVTRGAAEILGVQDRVGSIAAGMDADLVLLSGSPFAGDTVVESVFVSGRPVYRKP